MVLSRNVVTVGLWLDQGRVVVVQAGGVKTVMADRSGPLSLELAAKMSPEHTRLYG